jgi:hypothetical protein
MFWRKLVAILWQETDILMKFGHGTYPSIDVAGNEIMTGLSPACFREAAP